MGDGDARSEGAGSSGVLLAGTWSRFQEKSYFSMDSIEMARGWLLSYGHLLEYLFSACVLLHLSGREVFISRRRQRDAMSAKTFITPQIGYVEKWMWPCLGIVAAPNVSAFLRI